MDAQSLMETMKSSFLFSFRTGNLVMDTLITGIIIMCSSYLLTIAQKLSSLDLVAMMRWIKYRSSASIIITGHKKIIIIPLQTWVRSRGISQISAKRGDKANWWKKHSYYSDVTIATNLKICGFRLETYVYFRLHLCLRFVAQPYGDITIVIMFIRTVHCTVYCALQSWNF